MDKRAQLLEDDDEEETGNNELRQFYIRNLPSLMRISLYSIPTEVIHEIAVQIHNDDDYPEKWRKYASRLGIRDNSHLDDIKQTAKARAVMPMYFALRSSHCHDRSLGHLIKIFLEKRLDILRLIRGYVEEILENDFSSTTQVKRLVSTEENSFCSTARETESTTTRDLNCSVSSNGCTASGISSIQDIHIAECRNHDFDHSQSCSNSDDSNKMQVRATSGIKELRLEVLITIPGEERTSENSNSTTPIKRLESVEENSACTIAKGDSAAKTNLSNLNITSNSCVKSDISLVQSAHKAENRKCEFDNLQCCSNFDGSTQMQVKGDSDGKELHLVVRPSAPCEESLTVLIQHTEIERPLAEELATLLRDAGFVVRVLSEIEHILMMDAMGALSAIFQEVDFIVPLVTEKFLEQILPVNNARYLESQDSMNNRSLYQMYMNEYRTNRCVNFRIKPVLVPELSRNVVKSHLIFSSSLRLWSEVPKLIRVLRETWQLIQNFPHH